MLRKLVFLILREIFPTLQGGRFAFAAIFALGQRGRLGRRLGVADCYDYYS